MTLRGLGALACGVLAVAAGRVFGVVELIAVGVALVALVIVCVVVVHLPRGRLRVARRLRPERITVGQPAHVDLRLSPGGRLPSGLLRIKDGVADTGGAVLHSASIPRRHQRQATYRVKPPRRGIITIGPLRAERLDAFGLARKTVATLDASELIVHPEIVTVPPPPRPRAVDLASSVSDPAQDRRGDDFHALRPYEQGDDLRRVHWKATARHDDLMIREHDDSREGRTTVVIDVRASALTPPAFEQLLVGAASVLHAAVGRGDEVALVSTDGSGPWTAIDRRGLVPLLDQLARARLDPSVDDLDGAHRALRSGPRRGTLVSMVGRGHHTNDVDTLGAGFQVHIVMPFGDDGTTNGDTGPDDQAFIDAWAAEVTRRRPAGARS